ncbi:MAG: hypothetical protein CBD01_006990 [Euryarchaeota archaeon TMED141]|nr:MAG: hypothetical protein CBD01_006990 [Euryarchaeota archaeon TMED141]
MARVHVIVNPASRDGRCGKAWPDVSQRMEADGWEVEAFITAGPGDAARHAHMLVAEGHVGPGDLVVAVGGDGVVHEIASGLRGSEAVLGQIPFGSGNDFAITHGIPRNDIDGALRCLKEGVDRPSGAWRLEAHPAAPTSGDYAVEANPWDGPAEKEERIVRWTFLETDAGISSSISRAKLRRAKWLHGPIKYTWLGVSTIPVWRRRKVELQMDDNPAATVDLTLLASCTGETFGGGYRVCPGMAPTDEEAVLVVAPRLSRWRMLNLMGSVKKGEHVGIWGITSHRVRRVNLRPVDANGTPSDVPLDLPTYIQADGEPILQLPATLVWHPAQIIARGATSVPWASEREV